MSPPIVPQQGQPNANLFSMLAPTVTASPPPMAANRAPSYMGSTMTPTAAPNYTSPIMTPSSTAATRSNTLGAPAPTTAAKPASSSNFDDLWSMSLGTSTSKPQAASTPAKSIQDLQREKAQAGIWGSGQGQQTMGAGFGAFGSSSTAAPPSSSGNGINDLLF